MTTFEHLPDILPTLPFRRAKKGSVDWTLCTEYITTNYASSYTTNLESTLLRMNSLHQAIVQTFQGDTPEGLTEGFIEETLTPYCQLLAMALSHLPLHGGLVHGGLNFVWYDSFDEGKYESKNANLELLSCIYNLAASWAYVGAQHMREGVVGKMKLGPRAFQNAGGYYEMVDTLLSRLPSELVTGDFTHESLGLLKKLCCAMTHHCAYLKAEVDMTDKHPILAKIAREGGKMFEELAASIKESAWYANSKRGGKAVLMEQELRTFRHLFNARAHLHIAEVHSNASEQGVAVAHFNQAQKQLQQINKLHSNEMRAWISSIISNVNKGNERALSLNNTVYFCRVPDEVEMPEGLPRPLGKPTEHQSFFSFVSTRENNPFFGIVPAHVASTAAEWRERQRQLVSACVCSSKSTRKRSAELLQRLGVTAVIDILSGEARDRGRVPEQLRTQILSLRKNKTGEAVSVVQTLIGMVKLCDKIYAAADDARRKVLDQLEEESRNDTKCTEAYGATLWRNVYCPAAETCQYRSIQTALEKHEEDLRSLVVEPFGRAKVVLEENLRFLGRLDWPMEDLDAIMPFTKTDDIRRHGEKVMQEIEKLKKLVARIQEVERVQNERIQELERELETDDVARALSAVEQSQYQAILVKESQKISDMISDISKIVREEDEVVTSVEGLMESLAVLQSSDPVFEETQKVCNALEGACCTYAELQRDFNNMVKRGSAVLEGLEAILNSARSFVVSRKSEAERVRASLNTQIEHKMAELEHRKEAEIAVEESRRRQEELQRQVELLERQLNPQLSGRMAEVMRRQREAAAAFPDAPSPCPAANTPGAEAPPGYDLVANNSVPTNATQVPYTQYYVPYNPRA